MNVGDVRLVMASANPDKAAEIAAILGGVPGVVLLPRPASVADVDETGETLLENARLKARALADATDTPAVADDTGLEVEALDGAPGVRSARFAGDHATAADNVAMLLHELDIRHLAVPEQRRARFRTVALVAFPDGSELWAEGETTGIIAPSPMGTAGFGYDAVFVPIDGDGRTFAQMTPDEKHRISHRGRAFRSLAERLIATYSSG